MTLISAIKETSLGPWMVMIASAISFFGVCLNNILLDHVAAMLWWRWSNLIFVVYFFCRWRRWVNGGLSDAVMVGLYAWYAISNEWGLEHV